MNVKQVLGRQGESLALEYIQERGYQLLARNWRCAAGEIDLVAMDGECIVVLEVKTRRGTSFGHPFEAITTQKAQRLHVLAHLWLREHAKVGQAYRVDALGIVYGEAQTPLIEHLSGILP